MFCFKIIFYAYFFPFLSEEKEMKLTFFECAKERKRNRCDHSDKNARITRLAFFKEQKDATVVISRKMLVKHSHFRDILSVLRSF